MILLGTLAHSRHGCFLRAGSTAHTQQIYWLSFWGLLTVQYVYPKVRLPSSGRATLPMQTDIWMFRDQTMKMAGGDSTPCIRTDYGETLPRKIRRPVGKQTATCRDFVWGSDMPSAERCDESVF